MNKRNVMKSRARSPKRTGCISIRVQRFQFNMSEKFFLTLMVATAALVAVLLGLPLPSGLLPWR
jgi:cell division protein FtsL